MREGREAPPVRRLARAVCLQVIVPCGGITLGGVCIPEKLEVLGP